MNSDRTLAENKLASEKQTIALVFLFFLYYLVKAVYFAVGINGGVSPDETTHIGRSLVYSTSFWLPTDSPDSYQHGLVTHVPYLYYWLMGKLVHLNLLGVSDLVFLRCVNILISLGSLWFGWKTIALLTERAVTRLLFLVLCTNTLMWTFLASFVNYDNLVNFLAVASLYFLILYFKTRAFSHLLASAAFILAGCLTKLAFLPFAVIVLVAFLAREYRNLGPLTRELGRSFRFRSLGRGTLLVSCLVLLALNLGLYGGNLVQFGSIKPSYDTIVGLENAMHNRIFARGYVVQQFKSGDLTLAEARRMASTHIKHEGDRNGAYALLNKAAQEKLQGNVYRLDRFHYGFVWLDLMLGKTYGIMGHKNMEKTGMALAPYLLIILLAAGIMIRKFSRSDMNGNAAMLLFILAGYALVLMQLVNYPTYDESGVIVLALQGRYLFPVLFAAYALMAYYLTSFRSARVNGLAALAVAAVFIAGEFPWFLSQVTTDWYFSG